MGVSVGAIRESPLQGKYMLHDCKPVGATGRSPLHVCQLFARQLIWR